MQVHYASGWSLDSLSTWALSFAAAPIVSSVDLDANVDPPRSRPVRPSELERLMNLPANSTDGIRKVPGELNQERQLRRRIVANDAVHGSIVGFAVRSSGILSLRESTVAQPPLQGVSS